MKAVAVAFRMAWPRAGVAAADGDRPRDRLAAFRGELYCRFSVRADALFDLADAVVCAEGRRGRWQGLSLAPGHRARGAV